MIRQLGRGAAALAGAGGCTAGAYYGYEYYKLHGPPPVSGALQVRSLSPAALPLQPLQPLQPPLMLLLLPCHIFAGAARVAVTGVAAAGHSFWCCSCCVAVLQCYCLLVMCFIAAAAAAGLAAALSPRLLLRCCCLLQQALTLPGARLLRAAGLCSLLQPFATMAPLHHCLIIDGPWSAAEQVAGLQAAGGRAAHPRHLPFPVLLCCAHVTHPHPTSPPKLPRSGDQSKNRELLGNRKRGTQQQEIGWGFEFNDRLFHITLLQIRSALTGARAGDGAGLTHSGSARLLRAMLALLPRLSTSCQVVVSNVVGLLCSRPGCVSQVDNAMIARA